MAFVLFYMGCSKAPSSTEDIPIITNGSITGTVINIVTNKYPDHSVMVVLYKYSTSENKYYSLDTSYTDSTGHFSFESIIFGNYYLFADDSMFKKPQIIVFISITSSNLNPKIMLPYDIASTINYLPYDYFPLNVGNWYKYQIYSTEGTVHSGYTFKDGSVMLTIDSTKKYEFSIDWYITEIESVSVGYKSDGMGTDTTYFRVSILQRKLSESNDYPTHNIVGLFSFGSISIARYQKDSAEYISSNMVPNYNQPPPYVSDSITFKYRVGFYYRNYHMTYNGQSPSYSTNTVMLKSYVQK